MKVGTIAHLIRGVGRSGHLIAIAMGEKIIMAKGDTTTKWAVLGTADEEKIAIAIRREITEAIISGPFSLTLGPAPQPLGTSGLFQV
jgi:hypothetical protein